MTPPPPDIFGEGWKLIQSPMASDLISYVYVMEPP